MVFNAIFHQERYEAAIVFDQDHAKHKKVREVLRAMQVLGLEEKKAQTESSVDNSLWATAHYEAWARIAALQKLLKKLAKYAQ